MANYATNIFYARTENKADLDKIEAFLDDTFDGFVNRHSDSVDAEFTSRWVYPEEEIDRLIASLEAKDKTYIKSPEYPPNCSRLTQQDLIIRELEEKRRSWADS